MKIKLNDTKYSKEIKKTHELKIGTFFFFEKFIVAEINEGENVNWGNCQELIKLAIDFYPNEIKVNYISNRINEYSVSPADWLKFLKNVNRIKNYYIVCSSKSSFTNLIFEKLFFKKRIYQTNSLQTAIAKCLEQEKNQFTNP
ncbi:hypothetical protein LX95_01945 [Mesonia algae]|uniref:SpoIIAA-like protein n=1 Tax=Mesonia algae TaxID=213248 RepID=A0A2W7IJP5_9FLAO|nr:hypothetical protein [Mesonia algae]PZW39587.1 hypothetical protein LX95_01945 [Mesonia algae]